MKIIKGNAGYLAARKKRAILKTTLEFGIVIALLVLGIMETGDRMNWLTIVAVLGCLPAAKALVEVIMLWPHRTIERETAQEIAAKTEFLTTAYDLVFTNEKNIMPVECIVISNNTICGYAPKGKTSVDVAAKHIKQMLEQNQYTKMTVKLFENYTAFLSRAEGMNNIASVEKNDTKKKEERIKQILLNISL